MATLPPAAAWRHVGAREGFEVVFLRGAEEGYRCDGEVAAVEDGLAWAVRYSLVLDRSWETRSAHVWSRSPGAEWELRLETDGRGGWHVDGSLAPGLAGCLDVDLEASAFTNALPIHRLALAVGESADAPAAYVCVLEASVERLEQRYERLADDGARSRYDYAASVFEFRDVLVYDEAGLILEYPGIAVRAA
jgi:uncharacterized protein